MRKPLTAALLSIAFITGSSVAGAQNPPQTFTQTLSIGSSGPQVLVLQKLLNKDSDTRIAQAGDGSPGLETNYFGSLTRGAVVRFQEKYATEVLTPVGLAQGNGLVGAFTRAKLNSLATAGAARASVPAGAVSQSPALSSADFAIKDSEVRDIFAGDAMLAAAQQKILAAINAAITAGGGTVHLPTIATTELPSVIIKSLTPQSGLPGQKITIAGTGFLATSVVYFGPSFIVRSPTRDLVGNLTFTIPTIAPKRYDVAVVTGSSVSNTMSFIIADPRNPPVHITSVSPSSIPYGSTLTITGSGFSPTNNIVITSLQTIRDVPSADGKTITVQLAPENLRVSADIGNGTHSVPLGIYIVNEYGFSNMDTSFTMTI
jgi:peptidoglycan hydrolase-like protein with peptidoglycan-binding domain